MQKPNKHIIKKEKRKINKQFSKKIFLIVKSSGKQGELKSPELRSGH